MQGLTRLAIVLGLQGRPEFESGLFTWAGLCGYFSAGLSSLGFLAPCLSRVADPLWVPGQVWLSGCALWLAPWVSEPVAGGQLPRPTCLHGDKCEGWTPEASWSN